MSAAIFEPRAREWGRAMPPCCGVPGPSSTPLLIRRSSGDALIDVASVAAQIAAVEGIRPSEATTSTAQLARWIVVVAMGAALVGVLVLLASAASEVAADPSLSLEDGYWIGRLPWTPIGAGLVVGGSTAAVTAGILAVLPAGGNARRVLTLIAALPVVSWWSMAVIPVVGIGGAWCGAPPCKPPSFDVITIAYSLPEYAVVLLLAPALVVTALALTARSRRRRSRSSP